jgi:glycosyltransferase involved in cell wall biosynthesis
VAEPQTNASATQLSYAVVTPARDEAENLRRLSACLIEQTVRPTAWVVVDDGSRDGSPELVRSLAQEHPWILPTASPGGSSARGAPIVRAFHRALQELEPWPDVVVKLDADISMDPDHFERLLAGFASDDRLGIAGGTCYEQQPNGAWRQRHGTGPSVWGAFRAYRSACLREILPLEEHMGWDTLDLMKARLKGWGVEVLYDLPFRHHRPEGERDGGRFKTYVIQGEGAYFMGYRFSYLALRTLYRTLRSPAAVGLLVGYCRARFDRRPQCADSELRAYVRSEQSLRRLPTRVREALRPRATLVDRSV